MRTIVDLPEEQIEELKRLSGQTRLSRAALVREAVAEYLQHHPSEPGDEVFGIWRDMPGDGLAYQRRLRDEWDA